MGWAARANHRAIEAGQKAPAPKRRQTPPPPPALVKRFINGLLAAHFGITGRAPSKPMTRHERYQQREERRARRAAFAAEPTSRGR